MSRISHFLEASLRADLRIFSDEIDKQRFLSLLHEYSRTQHQHFRIAAFVLADDSLQILFACLGEEEHCRESLKRAVGQFLRSYQIRTGRVNEAVHFMTQFCVLTRPQDVLSCCIHLHRLPQEMGWCAQAAHYWWSSFQTYRESYIWEMVDPTCIYDLIETDPAGAGRWFRRMHRPERSRAGDS